MILKTDDKEKVGNDAGLNFQIPICRHDIRTLIEEELDGMSPQFDQARLPNDVEKRPAFAVWEAGTKDFLFKPQLVGVIVDRHPFNIYYTNYKYELTAVPDCISLDGITGNGNPGGSCKSCPLNQFGTGIGSDGCPTKGKACQNKYRIFLLQNEDSLPISLVVPAGSFRSYSDYLTKHIVWKGRRSYDVITRITLREGYSEEGGTYPELQFEVKAVLDDKSAAHMAEYSRWIRGLTRLPTVLKQLGGDVDKGVVKSKC